MEPNDLNPWEVENLEEFLYYWCPECDDRHQTRELFLQHAFEKHQNSRECLLKFLVKQVQIYETVNDFHDPEDNKIKTGIKREPMDHVVELQGISCLRDYFNKLLVILF